MRSRAALMPLILMSIVTCVTVVTACPVHAANRTHGAHEGSLCVHGSHAEHDSFLGAITARQEALADAGNNGAAVEPVQYRVILDQPQTQTVRFEMTVPSFDGLPNDDGVEVILPAWRPGRYVILDPAGTIFDVRAETLRGGELEVEKTAKATWRVRGTRGRGFRMHWTVYANSIADRTRHVDDTHAFLSPSSCFLYVRDLRLSPLEVRFDMPDSWRIAGGLPLLDAAERGVSAPDYDTLVDSPIEVGLHDRHEFQVAGRPHEVVIWPAGVPHDSQVMLDAFAAIVESCLAIYERPPYDRYVFLIHVDAGGGGTEHLNSTIMQTRRASLRGTIHDDDFDAWRGFLGLTAHEFFHTWNVKQFRPAGLSPYDYEHENYTKLLWVSEGTTSYYDELLPVRAGLVEVDTYLGRLGDAIDTYRRRPGRLVQDLESSSFDAWIKFNKRTPDSVNRTVSFYSKGALVSLLLDLDVRAATDGAASLDDVMRTLFEEFPAGSEGFLPRDVERILQQATGRAYTDFADRYVRGVDPLPLEEALAWVGLELVRDGDGDGDEEQTPVDMESSLGIDINGGDRVTIRSVRSDGPAYIAGLQSDDELVAIDGRRVGSGTQSLATHLADREPGDRIRVDIFRRHVLRTFEIELAGVPSAPWTVRASADATPRQREAFTAWTGMPFPIEEGEGE